MKHILAICLLVLLAMPAVAEWVPPRLVDGVWVTAGVTDEQARDFAQERKAEKVAAQQEQARRQAYYWQQWQEQRAKIEPQGMGWARPATPADFAAAITEAIGRPPDISPFYGMPGFVTPWGGTSAYPPRIPLPWERPVNWQEVWAIYYHQAPAMRAWPPWMWNPNQ